MTDYSGWVGNLVRERGGTKVGRVTNATGSMIWVQWHPAWTEVIEASGLEVLTTCH